MSEQDEWEISPDHYMKFKFKKRRDGIYVCLVSGLYGTNAYLYSPEELKKHLGGIITTFLWQIRNGAPIDSAAAFTSAATAPEKSTVIELQVDEKFLAEDELMVNRAMELYKQHLPKALAGAVDQHVEETVYRTLKESSGSGSFEFTSTERELINVLVQRASASLKRRVEARGRGGSEPEWTPERAEALLAAYEAGLQVLKDAKLVYKQNKHREDWKAQVKLAQKELPEHFIELLSSDKKNAEPSSLALTYAAEKMKVLPGEYLRKILTKARKARVRH
ncbi:MAG: hypothetical protein QOH63_471 [Acidobacteriota bacterium]|nr:hypothetical protein [Acidobacteriota bacterium]